MVSPARPPESRGRVQEAAKLCGVEPRAYPGEAILRAVRDPGTIMLARDLKSAEA